MVDARMRDLITSRWKIMVNRDSFNMQIHIPLLICPIWFCLWKLESQKSLLVVVLRNGDLVLEKRRMERFKRNAKNACYKYHPGYLLINQQLAHHFEDYGVAIRKPILQQRSPRTICIRTRAIELPQFCH